MSLNIKSAETHQLVQELAALTGETQTMAVTVAVRERLRGCVIWMRLGWRTGCWPSAGTPHPGFVNPSVAQITATSSTTSRGFPRDHRHVRPHSDSSRRR